MLHIRVEIVVATTTAGELICQWYSERFRFAYNKHRIRPCIDLVAIGIFSFYGYLVSYTKWYLIIAGPTMLVQIRVEACVKDTTSTWIHNHHSGA